MAGKDLELALRIKADLKQGQQALAQLGETIGDVGAATQATNTRLGATGTTVDQSTARIRAAVTAARAYETAQVQSGRATATLAAQVRGLGSTTAPAVAQVRQLEAASTSAGNGFSVLASSIKAATVTLAAGFGLAEIVRAADAWTAYENRLRLVTSSQQQLATASEDVYRIAQDTSQGLDSTGAVYQRFAQNAERLNITQKEAASLTDTVSKAIAVSGSSALSAEAALVQFGQALASGVLRGEEFNSVAEQAPALLMAIAEGLGVNIGQLRLMANEGQLTADVLVTALGNAQESVNQQFETRIKTIGQAAVELDNAFTRLVGTFSNGAGAGTALAAAISGLASVLDSLAGNAELLGAALDVALSLAAGKALVALTGLGAETLKNIAATKAATAATVQKAVADEGAAVAAQRAALAELERTRAAVAAAEANLAATAAEAKRTAAMAAAGAGLTRQAALDAAATQAAAAHAAAEARLATALQARAVASGTAASATQGLTAATAASAAASAAAGAASSLLARSLTAVVGVGGRVVGLLGGPVGIAISLALAATMFLDFGDKAEAGMNKAAESTENAASRIRVATRDLLNDMQLGDVSQASYDQLGQGIEQLEAQLKAAEQLRAQAQMQADSDVPQVPGADLPSLKEAEERVRALTGAIQQLQRERAGGRFDPVRKGEEYLDNLAKQYQRLQQLSGSEQAMAYLRANQIDVSSELGRKILAQAEANDRLDASNRAATESERVAEQQRKASAQAAEQLARSQLSYTQGLEKQAVTLNMSAAEVRAYELAEKGLTGTLQARAQAALALIDAAEQQRRADANARANAGLEAEFLRSAGREADAALLEIRTRFADMRTEFEQAGNEAGLAWLDKLIPVAEAKVRVDDVQRQMDRILAEQQRQEQSVNVQQDAGLITELQARQQILDIHRQTYQQLEEMRPVLEELAQQPGAVGEAASAALAALDEQAQRLLATTSLLAETLRDGLTSGLTEAITGLAKGTMDIRDAINAVAESVANALLRIAAESMAQSAVNGLAKMFTDVVPAATQAVSAIGTVSAAKVAADTTMTASGVTAATTTATAQATAATATTTAWTPAAIAASIGSFGGAAAIGLAAVMAALAFQAFATGGHVRGPGTRTSDSIPALLSNDEFVTRAAVVTQPGALPFLEDFNERGMPALDDWATRARHATGGLAGVPAPALPSPGLGTAQLAEPARPGGTLNNNVNLYAVQNPDDVAAMAWGKAGQEHYMVYLQQNASTVRQVLGV